MSKTTSLNQLHASKPMSYVTASVLLHGGLIAGLLIASNAGLIPEGTEPLKDRVEISTLEVSKGEQITTSDPGPVALPEKQNQAAIVPQKNEIKKSAEESKSEEIATKLPEKEKSEPPPSEEPQKAIAVIPVIEESPVVTESETSDLQIQQIDEEAKAFAAENKPEIEKIETAPEVIESNQVSGTESETASATAIVIPEIPKEETASNASGEGSFNSENNKEATTATNDLSFGVPSGTRSYLDLKQRPGNVPPQYPTQARRNGWQGRVLLNYYVSQNGAVERIQLRQSSGFKELDDEAIRAISKYRFTSGQEGWTEHPVDFLLKGPTQQIPGRLRTKEARSGN